MRHRLARATLPDGSYTRYGYDPAVNLLTAWWVWSLAGQVNGQSRGEDRPPEEVVP